MKCRTLTIAVAFGTATTLPACMGEVAPDPSQRETAGGDPIAVTNTTGAGGAPAEAMNMPVAEHDNWAEYLEDDGAGWAGASRDLELRVHQTTEQELQVIADARAEMYGQAPADQARQRQADDATARTLAVARETTADEELSVTVVLQDRGFGFHGFREASATRRQQLVELRREQLADDQQQVSDAIAALGGEVEGRMWLTNALFARVAAANVPRLLQIPGVTELAIAEDELTSEWDGAQVRAGLHLDRAQLLQSRKDFYAGCFSSPRDDYACHDGGTGNRTNTSQPVRIAVIETGGKLNRHHVGWEDWADGPSRIRAVYDCTHASCVDDCPTGQDCPEGDAVHGTQVAWAALGSIEQGQDQDFPGSHTAEQVRRSGIAKEAELIYFSVDGSLTPTRTAQAVMRAIERAVEDGADVINMSWGLAHCSDVDTRTYDLGGLNATLRAALLAGALPVKSAGNEGHDDPEQCTLTYPAWRPEVLAVGGLDSLDKPSSDINDLGLLDLASVSTSRGGATLRIAGTTDNATFSGVDIMAPACPDLSFSNSFNERAEPWGYRNGFCGTSSAAPIVSGTAALLRETFYTLGWNNTASDARQLLNIITLFGDNWDPDWSVGDQRPWGVSDVSGAGRLHPHYPSDRNMMHPIAWGSQKIHLQAGQTVDWDVWFPWAEPREVVLWKWAVTWFDQDLNEASDIVIEVYDKCNGNRTYGADRSKDIRKKVWLPWYLVSNRCLVMRATALHTPAGGTDIFTADYFQGGSYEASYSEHMAGVPE